MPDGRPGGGLPAGIWGSAHGADEGGSGGRLDKGWQVLGAAGMALGPSDIVLAHPAIGVALLQIEPFWTPDAIARLREILDRSGFGVRFPGHLPIIHRRFRSDLLAELPTLLSEAFAWQPPLTLPPGSPWVEALREAVAIEEKLSPSGVAGPPSATPVVAPPPVDIAPVRAAAAAATMPTAAPVAHAKPPAAAPAVAPASTVATPRPASPLPLPVAAAEPLAPRPRFGLGMVGIACGGLVVAGALFLVMFSPDRLRPQDASPDRSAAAPAANVAAPAVASLPAAAASPPAPTGERDFASPAADPPREEIAVAPPGPPTSSASPSAETLPATVPPEPTRTLVQLGTSDRGSDAPAESATPVPPALVAAALNGPASGVIAAVALEPVEMPPEPAPLPDVPTSAGPQAAIAEPPAPAVLPDPPPMPAIVALAPIEEPPVPAVLPDLPPAPALVALAPIEEPPAPAMLPESPPAPTVVALAPIEEPPAPAVLPESPAAPVAVPSLPPVSLTSAPPAAAPAAAAPAALSAPATSPAAASPAEATPPVSSAGQPGPADPPPMVAALLRRGEALWAIGDISGARRFFERAAASGSGRAALAMGGTYDPRILAQLGARGIPPDRAAARTWYQRAAALGEAEAAARIAALDAAP